MSFEATGEGINFMESPPDKVVLVGDVGVGKTTLFMRYRTGEFIEHTTHNPRLGEYHKKWKLEDGEVSLTLFDTAGIERHMSTIPPTYFRWSKVLMLVYSIDDADTFNSLTNWADNAVGARAGRSQSDIITVLVGNKLDLEDDRQVTGGRAKQYAENNDISEDMIFEVSAMDGTGVQDMFDKIASKVRPVGAQLKTKTEKHSKQKASCCA